MKIYKSQNFYRITGAWLICLALFLLVVSDAQAEDKVLDASIASVETRSGKSGPYVRMIINETRTLSGVEYKVGIPANAFGELVPQAQKFSAGQTVKMIVSPRKYQGRASYLIRAFIE